MNDYLFCLFLAAFSFLLGSIPFGLILSKIFAGKDIRKMGSGNIGATNVLRSAGPTLGILTLILDISKGYVAVIFGGYLANLDYITLHAGKSVFIAGLFVFLGHVLSVFLKFKGGKGVAVGLGVFLAINPYTALLAIFVFLLVVVSFRYVSLGSILGSLSLIFWSLVLESSPPVILLAILISLMVLYRHKSNLQRLFEGTENKLFSKRTDG